MSVDDGVGVLPLLIDVSMKAPLTGRSPLPLGDVAVKRHLHHVLRRHLLVRNSCRRDDQAALDARAQIPRRAVAQPGRAHPAGGLQKLAPLSKKSHPCRSGYKASSPSLEAVDTPRSVISPVTRREGVTSKA